jgi:hypothetical protein
MPVAVDTQRSTGSLSAVGDATLNSPPNGSARLLFFPAAHANQLRGSAGPEITFHIYSHTCSKQKLKIIELPLLVLS